MSLATLLCLSHITSCNSTGTCLLCLYIYIYIYKQRNRNNISSSFGYLALLVFNSTFNNIPQRYRWYIVENVVKHHQANIQHYSNYIVTVSVMGDDTTDLSQLSDKLYTNSHNTDDPSYFHIHILSPTILDKNNTTDLSSHRFLLRFVLLIIRIQYF